MSPPHPALTPALEAAIDWLVRLDSGNAQAVDLAQFESWLAASKLNRQAWESLNNTLAPAFAPLANAGAAQAASRALRASGVSHERRRLLRNGSALLVLLGLSSTLAVQRRMPLQGLLSDAYSGTAERRTLSLPDGSLLTLNARTAVDIHFSASLRSLHLLQGELCVQVAADNRRPLEVLTAQGSVRALGTRFSVRQMAEDSLVGVQQHSVQVTNRSGQQALVSSGQALRFARDRLLLLSGDQSHVDAWMQGRLDVQNESLGAVVDALRPYRQGLLRISRAAAQLRVFGVFSLDDSDRALQSLAQVLPITVNQYGPLTLIDVS